MLDHIINFLLLRKFPFCIKLNAIACYVILIFYTFTYIKFFSMQPGPASAMTDRMARSSMGMIPFLLLIFTIYPSAIISTIKHQVRCRKFLIRPNLLLIVPVVQFVCLAKIYGLMCQGHATRLHNLLYHL